MRTQDTHAVVEPGSQGQEAFRRQAGLEAHSAHSKTDFVDATGQAWANNNGLL